MVWLALLAAVLWGTSPILEKRVSRMMRLSSHE